MSLDNVLKNLDVSKVKAPSGLTYAQELALAANELRDCIQARIRRESMCDVLSVATLADVEVDGMSLKVRLKVQNALRPSIFKKWNQSDANVFWLLNDGFVVNKPVWFRNIKNFGYREAEQFVEKGIADFNRQNRWGIKIEVKRPLLYYGRIG